MDRLMNRHNALMLTASLQEQVSLSPELPWVPIWREGVHIEQCNLEVQKIKTQAAVRCDC